jgi:hypothetical protein
LKQSEMGFRFGERDVVQVMERGLKPVGGSKVALVQASLPCGSVD